MVLFNPVLQEKISTAGIIAVLVIDDVNHVRPLMQALMTGGIRAIELTMRTDCALEAMTIVAKEFPEIILGAGTVLNPQQLVDVHTAGAHFAVAPGLNVPVLEAAAAMNFSFAPGIATPSDIETALMHECKVLKFFPAEGMGGLPFLNNMYAPYKHLNLQFIPLGGLNLNNMNSYLAAPCIAALGGSWIAPAALIQAGDWKSITENAAAAVNNVEKIRK